jgi:hypothetical protein
MVEKAEIIVLDEKRRMIERIPVMYNPSEYEYGLAAKYSRVRQGQPQFNHVEFQEFSVALFFDTYEAKLETDKDVRKTIHRLVNVLKPTIAGKENKRPPECIFSWGKFNITGVVTKVNQKFTMFLPDGIPVRATVTVVIQPTASVNEVKELTGKEACRKLWTVRSGDRLDLIAFQALKDPAEWRKIANANHIFNPFTFPAVGDIGRLLVIPE